MTMTDTYVPSVECLLCLSLAKKEMSSLEVVKDGEGDEGALVVDKMDNRAGKVREPDQLEWRERGEAASTATWTDHGEPLRIPDEQGVKGQDNAAT